MKFGDRYCNIFLHDQHKYKDIAWQKAVRKCLQQQLYNYFSSTAVNCTGVENFAINSHVKCYEEPDSQSKAVTYCNLPVSDKKTIEDSIDGRDK